MAKQASIRLGSGFDIHRTKEHVPLVLGGVEIPCEFGLVSETDGDVVLHALADAVLAAAGLPDLGQLFPPGKVGRKDLRSAELMKEVATRARGAGLQLQQIDVTILAEAPRLAPHYNAMRENIAALLGLGAEDVALKARTMEGLGEVGSGRAVAALAIVLALRKPLEVGKQAAERDSVFEHPFPLAHEGELPGNAVVVSTDGGSRGNPGPAAAAVVGRDAAGKALFTERRFLGRCTNNVAEYRAVLLALEALRKSGLGERPVLVQLDSQLVFNQIVGRYRVKHPELRSLLKQVLRETRRFAWLRFRLVSREENREADAAVNRALDEAL